jgi:hypothetical protein
MKKINYIVFTALLGVLFCLLYSFPLRAQEEVRWTQGEPVMISAACREEKDIMEMVKADTESKENFISRMRMLHIFQRCVNFNPPSLFNIHSIIIIYKDFSNRETSVLALAYADNPKEIIAYTLAKRPILKDKQVRE